MAFKLTYAITDFLNDRMTRVLLQAELAGAGLAAKLTRKPEHLVENVNLYFDVDPAPEKAMIDAAVAAHTGDAMSSLVFHASSKIVDEQSLPVGSTFQDISGVATSPDFFVSDLAKVIGRVVGQCKAVGAGAELRIIEEKDDGTVTVLSAPFAVPDTSDKWQGIAFNTNAPPSPGQNVYKLQGRVNGATSASIRFAGMSLMELR